MSAGRPSGSGKRSPGDCGDWSVSRPSTSRYVRHYEDAIQEPLSGVRKMNLRAAASRKPWQGGKRGPVRGGRVDGGGMVMDRPLTSASGKYSDAFLY